MRCPKCGYNSFDYLDRCPKCQTDWTMERNQLNLPGMKPNPISLQEILDREAQVLRQKPSQFKEETPFSPSSPVELDPAFLLEGGISLDDSISLDLDLGAKGPSIPRKEEGEIEFSLEGLDLSIIPNKEK